MEYASIGSPKSQFNQSTSQILFVNEISQQQLMYFEVFSVVGWIYKSNYWLLDLGGGIEIPFLSLWACLEACNCVTTDPIFASELQVVSSRTFR